MGSTQPHCPEIRLSGLHGIAALSGGALFICSWWGKRIGARKSRYFVAGVVALYAIVLGTVSVAFPGIVPFITVNSAFAFVADGTNVAGGLLFIVAAAGFYFLSTKAEPGEFRLFSVFCVLNGLAGLFFPITSSWAAVWWFWHLVRVSCMPHLDNLPLR